MAFYNNKREGDELEPCPVCLAKVSKRRLALHKNGCWDKYRRVMTELMECPLYRMHIFPRKFLNHHLETNCDAALNQLRMFFQKDEYSKVKQQMPPDYLADIPDEELNQHNKQLLYLLKGKDISKRADLFPNEPSTS